MRPAIAVILWLVLLSYVYAIQEEESAFITTTAEATPALDLIKRLQLPDTYTDNTPYRGLDFTSTNVTVPLRTQRDIGLNVTIDRWLWPAIDLKGAYFGNDYSAQKLSHVEEVMYMGYRRLVVDLYWDPDRRTWQLCPIKLPSSAFSKRSNNEHASTNTTNGMSSSTTPIGAAAATRKDNNSAAKQHEASTFGHFVNKLVPISTEDVDVGQYKCAPWYTFRHFMDSVNHYLQATDLSTLPSETNLMFLILNLHQFDSSSSSNDGGSDDASSLRDVIRSAVVGTDRNTSRLYTPNDLIRDRSNLTASFGVQGTPYYEPSIDPETGALTSATAWPTLIYLIQRDIQLLVGFGYNDLPSNTNYDVARDQDTLFNATQLGAGWYMNEVNLTDMDAMGWANCARPANNTFVLPTGNETTVSPSHPGPSDTLLSWSWAYMNDRYNDTRFTYNKTLEAVQCGYSPYFTNHNYTDDNAGYSVNDTTHLADNILGTIWSWDVGEPKINNNPHCAMIQRSNGRWKAGDCTELLRVACRQQNDPNKWMLTSTYVSYDRAFSACPDDYVFDCPRIPQQNRMLYDVLTQDLMQNGPQDSDIKDPTHHVFWINLNSGNSGSCWVVGLFSKCWWLNDNASYFQRLIRTSAVAGVIVLILFGIFAWIKCARWWRNRKARIRKHFIKDLLARREYVTVPA
ncbi:hypothetical protein BDB00DRAFT_851441 [Zychaea mexicana]|uniref:uncharacterized protein n=1 Tax=Zychaea mexicana TaxID=64656 RepID=UPI0022FE82A8|nr:uncharacterized protein BDB00DRAFT_851441 [Zychaea mexicana]KAI9485094.1 hypothetical protein BDB00DRAFT_851441 [Zychaea mexicana]